MKLSNYLNREVLDQWCSRQYTLDGIDYWQGNRLVILVDRKHDQNKISLMVGGFAVLEGPFALKENVLSGTALRNTDGQLAADSGYGHRKILRDLRAILAR